MHKLEKITKTEPLHIHWDEVIDRGTRVMGSYAMITGGGHVRIYCRIGGDLLFAVSERTGQRYAVVRTGNKVRWGWAVAVRIIPAVDTGDAAGTLEFAWENGYPGNVNRSVFGW